MSKTTWGLIIGGGVLAVAGVAAYLYFSGDETPTSTTPETPDTPEIDTVEETDSTE